MGRGGEGVGEAAVRTEKLKVAVLLGVLFAGEEWYEQFLNEVIRAELMTQGGVGM